MTNHPSDSTNTPDAGISPAALSPLGALIAAMDAAEKVIPRHYVLPLNRKAPPFAKRYGACGKEGVEPNTLAGTESQDCVTCQACKVALAVLNAKADKRALARVRKAPVRRRLVDRDSRDRLVAAGLVRLDGDFVVAVKGAA